MSTLNCPRCGAVLYSQGATCQCGYSAIQAGSQGVCYNCQRPANLKCHGCGRPSCTQHVDRNFTPLFFIFGSGDMEQFCVDCRGSQGFNYLAIGCIVAVLVFLAGFCIISMIVLDNM